MLLDDDQHLATLVEHDPACADVVGRVMRDHRIGLQPQRHHQVRVGGVMKAKTRLDRFRDQARTSERDFQPDHRMCGGLPLRQRMFQAGAELHRVGGESVRFDHDAVELIYRVIKSFHRLCTG